MTTDSYLTRLLPGIALVAMVAVVAPAQTAQADAISAVAVRGMLEDLRRNGAPIASVRLNPFAVDPVQAPPALGGPAHTPARLAALRRTLGARARGAEFVTTDRRVRSRAEAYLALSDVVDVAPGVATVTVTSLYRVDPRDRVTDYLTVRYRVERKNGVWVLTRATPLGAS